MLGAANRKSHAPAYAHVRAHARANSVPVCVSRCCGESYIAIGGSAVADTLYVFMAYRGMYLWRYGGMKEVCVRLSRAVALRRPKGQCEPQGLLCGV